MLDATNGQNAIRQAEVFTKSIGCTGVILTKLDGTAKGGVVVAIRQALNLPVKFIGVGEGIDDLQPFDTELFVRRLVFLNGRVTKTRKWQPIARLGARSRGSNYDLFASLQSPRNASPCFLLAPPVRSQTRADPGGSPGAPDQFRGGILARWPKLTP